MGICIEKFIVVNNYGTIEFRNGVGESSFSASQANSGATGMTIADFVNGRRVRRNTGSMSTAPEIPEEEEGGGEESAASGGAPF